VPSSLRYNKSRDREIEARRSAEGETSQIEVKRTQLKIERLKVGAPEE